MAKKKKGNTGFRNEALFCFNCGGSYKIQYPQPINMAAALMSQFEKDHKNCEPTWKEPVLDTTGKTEQECAIWWYKNGEHGISSKTMYNHLTSGMQLPQQINDRGGHPRDPDDFKRCYKLLQAVPHWKQRLNELKTISPVWEKLVDNWDQLTKMFEQNVKEDWKNFMKIGMHDFMEKLGC